MSATSLFGSLGPDNIVGGSGQDWISGAPMVGDPTLDMGADALRGMDGSDTLLGWGGNDTLQGDNGDDSAEGMAGNDLLGGGVGNDTLLGGANDDSINGDLGNDLLDGGPGADTLVGAEHADTLIGGSGNDRLDASTSLGSGKRAFGGDGADTIFSGTSGSLLDGGDGPDIILSGSANSASTLMGGGGADTLYGSSNMGPLALLDGGLGDDLYLVNGYAGVLVDEGGADTVSGLGSFTLPGGIEDLVGAALLRGNDLDNRITGSSGADSLDGAGGADTLRGGVGNDTLDGGDGQDLAYYDGVRADYQILDLGNGAYRIVDLGSGQNNGTDTLVRVELLRFLDGIFSAATGLPAGPGSGNDSITGGNGPQTLDGLGGNDTLAGGEGDDSLIGGSGDDLLAGEAGADTLHGGAGNDSLDGGAGLDVARFAGPRAAYALDVVAGRVRVIGPDGADTLDGVELLVFDDLAALFNAATGGFSMSGSPNADTIPGSPGADTLDGLGGNDSLAGLAGADLLIGGAGADTLDGGAGADTMEGGADSDLFFVDDPGDLVTELPGGGNADQVRSFISYALPAEVERLLLLNQAGDAAGTGNALANLITGNGGANRLAGGEGADTLRGLAGADTLDGGLGSDSLEGGDGTDAAVFGGNRLDYEVATIAGGWRITGINARAADGADTVTGVESFRFADVLLGEADLLAPPPAPGVLQGISVPVGADLYSNNVVTNTWSVTFPPEMAESTLGPAWLVNLHADIQVLPGFPHFGRAVGIGVPGSYTPPPATSVTTFTYTAPVVFDRIMILEHTHGVTQITLRVGDTPETLTSLGPITGSLGPVQGVLALREFSLNRFDLPTGTSGRILEVTFSGANHPDGTAAIYRLLPILAGTEPARIVGTAAGDSLPGTWMADTMTGGDGADTLRGARGDDLIEGGEGMDSAIFTGARADYAINRLADGSLVIRDTRTAPTSTAIDPNTVFTPPDGADTLRGVESFVFTDGAWSEAELGPLAPLVTEMADSVIGTPEADTLDGLGGNDTILGLEGDDSLLGGAGDDSIAGGSGANTLRGGTGADTLVSLSSADSLDGGEGDDLVIWDVSASAAGEFIWRYGDAQAARILGGSGPDTLYGSVGGDTLVGNAGADSLQGFIGDDTLDGGAANDTLVGDGGADTLRGGDGNDSLDGGAGEDLAVFAGSRGNYSIAAFGADGLFITDTVGGEGADTIVGVERFSFAGVIFTRDELLAPPPQAPSPGPDSLVGGDAAESINGLAGNDTILGMGGADTLAGGAGNDSLDGGAGSDLARYSGTWRDYDITDIGGDLATRLEDRRPGAPDGTDTTIRVETFRFADGDRSAFDVANEPDVSLGELLNASPAWITYGYGGADSITGTAGNERLDGGDGGDSLSGAGGADTLIGDAGADTLDGGAGADSLIGGADSDTYVVDDPGDLVIETADGGNADIVRSFVTYTLPEHVERLFLQPSEAINGTGNGLANVINGNNGANVLTGLAGNDTLRGLNGADTLEGGAGNDLIEGGDGADAAVFGGNYGQYAIAAIAGGFTLVGPDGADTVTDVESFRFADQTRTNLNLLGAGAGPGADTLAGDAGANSLDGLGGHDLIAGAGGNDTLLGNAGDDLLRGEAGDDDLRGGPGADTLEGGPGDDTLEGGAGNDLADYAASPAAVVVDLLIGYAQDGHGGFDALAGIEILRGSAFADLLIGGAGNETFRASAGADTIEAGEGFDVLDFTGRAAALYAEIEAGIASGGIEFSGIEGLIGGAGADVLIGDAGANLLAGGAGNDVLTGGGGNDTLDGGPGEDTMSGGVGSDVYIVDSAGDLVMEGATAGTDWVWTTLAAHTLGARMESLAFIGSGPFAGTGNVGRNEIAGGAGADTLSGLGGGDILRGGGGRDILIGGEGVDRFVFDAASLGPAATHSVTIQDLDRALKERLDLVAVDAVAGTPEDDAFTFIGTAAFTGVAGQLRWADLGAQRRIEGDVNGDGVADLTILANAAGPVTAAWFLL